MPIRILNLKKVMRMKWNKKIINLFLQDNSHNNVKICNNSSVMKGIKVRPYLNKILSLVNLAYEFRK